MKFKPLIPLFIIILFTGCSVTQIGIGPGGTATPTVVKSTPIMESSPQPVTATPQLAVTETSFGPTQAQQTDEIFLIAVGDYGQSGKLVGCGDSLVPVQLQIPATKGVLKAAMGELLSLKERFYGQSGLYNALYQSNLQVDRVSIDAQGQAQVYLTGKLILGGECDNPRVEEQINQTALQFSTVNAVSVFVNDKPLKDTLSLK